MSTGKGANSGVGFAIPIDGAKGLVEQILQYGKVVRPILGITIAPPQTVRQMGVEGVLILEVPPGGPAANAGLRGTYRYSSFFSSYTIAASIRHLSTNISTTTCDK